MMADTYDVKHLRLVTITLDSSADRPGESPADRAARLMAGFRKLRQSASWNQVRSGYTSPDYAWVLEFGGKNMRPHLHILVHDPTGVIPLAETLRDESGHNRYRSFGDWLSSQSPAAQAFYALGRRYGLGHFSCLVVESNASGAANYMSKYLSKSVDTAKLLGFRRRVFGMSRSWPRDAQFMPRFDISTSVVVDEPPLSPDYMFKPYSTMDSITRMDAMRSDITYQLQGSRNVFDSPALDSFLDADKEMVRLYRRLTPDERQLVQDYRYTEQYSVGSVSFDMIYARLPPAFSVSDSLRAYLDARYSRANALKVFRAATGFVGSMKFVHYVLKLDSATRDPFEREFLQLFSEIYKVHLEKRSVPEYLKSDEPWQPRRPHKLFGSLPHQKQTTL